MFWSRYMGGPGDWGFPDHWWGWILPLTLIDLVLRGFALYRSARSGQNLWFIFLLIVNSLGILPAIYLLIHRQASNKKK